MDTSQLEDLILKVAGKGFRVHGSEFPGIRTPLDMLEHIRQTLADRETRGFRRHDGGDVYANERTGTVIVLNPHDLVNGGTCYRMRPGGASLDEHLLREHKAYNIAPALHKREALKELHPDEVGREAGQRQKRDAELDRADEAVLRRYHQSRHERRLGLGRSLGRGLPGDDGE